MIVVVFSWAAREPPEGALLFWRLNRDVAGVMVGDGVILGLSGAYLKSG